MNLLLQRIGLRTMAWALIGANGFREVCVELILSGG
jgi:hypothetical protein